MVEVRGIPTIGGRERSQGLVEMCEESELCELSPPIGV
jgi:hypothetical protein